MGNIAYAKFSRFSVLRMTVQTAHAINFNVVSTLETEHLQILAVLVFDVLLYKQTEHMLSISMLSQYWKHSICKF